MQFIDPADLRHGRFPINHASAKDNREPVPHRYHRACIPRCRSSCPLACLTCASRPDGCRSDGGSRVRVCSVIANCCGRAPFKFSWRPKWPATSVNSPENMIPCLKPERPLCL
eukprot:1231957-Rhodomonas_salina.3